MDKGVLHGLDLFSGIGGITKALDGYVRPVAYCEIEPYARAVLLSRMHSGDLPLAPIWDDVLTLHGAMLPQIDIIYGGFPCQDISVAGKQVGLGGERSGLFSEICRLAKETKAEWLYLENVPNIRSKGLGTVLKALAEFGYDTRWGMLSAADVGANHKRERWFLLAHANSHRSGPRRTKREGQWGRNAPISPSPSLAYPNYTGFGIGMPTGASQNNGAGTSEGQGAELANPRGQSSAQKDTSVSSFRKERDTRPDDSRSDGGSPSRNDWWLSEPNVGRVAHGIPKRVDRLRALGNAVVPAQAREAFERLMGLK